MSDPYGLNPEEKTELDGISDKFKDAGIHDLKITGPICLKLSSGRTILFMPHIEFGLQVWVEPTISAAVRRN